MSSLLNWLPGETFFSLCSRHHRICGRSFSWQTAMTLFGHRSAGTQHDFPSRLDDFVQRTLGGFETADRIARERTLLKFYSPFLDESRAAAAALAMRGPSVAHLKYRLGLLTSRFRANHPLKACRQCVEDDLERYGWCYWHLQHQFPGVWMCPVHWEQLSLATVKSTGVGRFQWCLPEEAVLSLAWASDLGRHVGHLERLAHMTSVLIDEPKQTGWLNPLSVQRTIRARLLQRAWLTPAGTLRTGAVAPAFLRFCDPMRCVPELAALPSTLDEAQVQIGRLVRPLRAGVHPLRWLVAMAWLFDDAHDFMASHEHSGADALAERTTDAVLPQSDEVRPGQGREAELIRLLKEGNAVSSGAVSVGVDVATAIAWATKAGVQTKKRPKLLKPELRAALIARLSEGDDKAAVAGWAGIAVGTVTRLLRSEVGLHSAWQAARFNRAQTRARTAWRQIWRKSRSAGVKLMRAMNPAAYAWLYRNDRDWLLQYTPHSTRVGAPGCVKSIRWDDRDAALNLEVQQAILQLEAEGYLARGLRLWQVYQIVPSLKAKLAQLHRLPLTRRTLNAALSRRLICKGQTTLFE